MTIYLLGFYGSVTLSREALWYWKYVEFPKGSGTGGRGGNPGNC